MSLNSERRRTSITILLTKQLRLLTTFNISGSDITNKGEDMIAAVLLETLSLTELDLSNTMLNSTRCTKIISTLKNISSLKLFNISNNYADDRASDCIKDVISSNSLIEVLNLSHNKLSYTGILNIATALSESIKAVNISNNFIASDTIAGLATALSKCPALQELNVSHNLLGFANVLTIAQVFRYHPALKILDLSGNGISFLSACESIVDVTLSVNHNLSNLNVGGRNIRPRFNTVTSYLSPSSSEGNSNTFAFQNLNSLKHSNHTRFFKVAEACPIYVDDVMSYYVDHLGGAFYNQYHNFAIVVPPHAVLQGDCVEIQGTANYFGPYKLPDGFYPISSYFWISANYKFKVPVYLIMNHYAKIRNLEDVRNLHVLCKSTLDLNANDNLMMSVISNGVYFDDKIGYCVLAANHFCSYCQAKSYQYIPDYLTAYCYTYDEPSSGSFIAEVSFCPTNSECRKVTM